MYPILCTGNSVNKALEILIQQDVDESKVIVLSLFTTPEAIRNILRSFPKVKILTSEVHPVAPKHFGQKYFGTD